MPKSEQHAHYQWIGSLSAKKESRRVKPFFWAVKPRLARLYAGKTVIQVKRPPTGDLAILAHDLLRIVHYVAKIQEQLCGSGFNKNVMEIPFA